AVDDLRDELGKLRIDRRLAPAERYDGRRGSLDGVEALLESQSVRELARVAFDRAADAREVARVEGLEHEHEGIAFVAGDGITGLERDRAGREVKRESHRPSFSVRIASRPAAQPASEVGRAVAAVSVS